VSNPLETMTAALGKTASDVTWCLKAVEVADRMAGDDRVLFHAMRPNSPFRNVIFKIYEAHCRELAERRNEGGNLDCYTDAEILLAACEVSLVAPLSDLGAAVYAEVFERVMGIPSPVTVREAWPGQVNEEIASIKRKKAPRD